MSFPGGLGHGLHWSEPAQIAELSREYTNLRPVVSQIAEWRQEGLRLVGQAQALTEQARHLQALIELAQSQIKRDPSRVIGFGACLKSVMALKAPRVGATFIS